MAFRKISKEPSIEIIPLIDVIFLLLIFFMMVIVLVGPKYFIKYKKAIIPIKISEFTGSTTNSQEPVTEISIKIERGKDNTFIYTLHGIQGKKQIRCYNFYEIEHNLKKISAVMPGLDVTIKGALNVSFGKIMSVYSLCNQFKFKKVNLTHCNP